MLKTQAFAAGETKEFREEADFFRILQASSPITVTFIRSGSVLEEAEAVSPGYAEQWTKPFDAIQIFSAAAQNVQFVMRRKASARYDIQTLTTPPATGAFTQTNPTIGTASAQLSAANGNRKYFGLQNNSANIVYLNLSGAAATVAGGVQVPPGGYYSLDRFMPSSAITAIASVASAVILIEA